MDWYKLANEFVGPDATMTPDNIADAQRMKMGPADTQGGIGGVSLNGLGLSPKGTYGKEETFCGGCGLPLSEYAHWSDYSVSINGQLYRAYKCRHCGFGIQPFNIKYTKHPKSKRKEKKRVKNLKRLGHTLSIREAQYKPGSETSVTYNNPANSPTGRTDYSMDARVIPWKDIDENAENIYNSNEQKGKSKDKIIKVKKDGKIKYIKVKYLDGIDGIMPSNTTDTKGQFSKQPRYNPAKGKNKNDGHGSWPHNRDYGKGGYQIDTPESIDGDWRTRFTLWSDYIRDRSTNILTLVKPV